MRNYRWLFFFVVLLLSGYLRAQKPKLVVGIVVDQMRTDYIYRYWDKYGDNGIKKLVNEGFFCKNAHFNYAPTYTGPGHASIYTGTVPSVHGIISNYWFNKEVGGSTYCVGDSNVRSVGSLSPAGEMSPNKLLTTTIADELQLAMNFRAKTIGIGMKDRSAILPVGHSASAAYWFDSGSGGWISSTHYMKELPDWLKFFNNETTAKHLTGKWETLLPVEQYSESREDNSAGEVAFSAGGNPTFPYDLDSLRLIHGYGLIKMIPAGNSLTVEVAKAAIKNEGLGKDKYTDMLTIGFSSTDYIGHQFGPHSVEIEDTYLRFDKDIEGFLGFLDKEIGKENYLIFLTSDHGAVQIPAWLQEHKIPAGVVVSSQIFSKATDHLRTKFGVDSLLMKYSNYQFFVHDVNATNGKVNVDEVKKELVAFCLTLDEVANALTKEQLVSGYFENTFLNRLKQGISQKRSGDVVVLYKPGWIADMTKGTTHGSPYTYDSHVPLIWYGVGIRQGESSVPIDISDIAPTLSILLDIAFPSGCTGKPIPFLVK